MPTVSQAGTVPPKISQRHELGTKVTPLNAALPVSHHQDCAVLLAGTHAVAESPPARQQCALAGNTQANSDSTPEETTALSDCLTMLWKLWMIPVSWTYVPFRCKSY
jgi:hypothetical protein